METSLRFSSDSKKLRIHAKEKLSLDSRTLLQVLLGSLSFHSFKSFLYFSHTSCFFFTSFHFCSILLECWLCEMLFHVYRLVMMGEIYEM
ncbi:Outer envelope pore protein 21, chloroplastic [Apostasia shenzhenica]|uniref:Outer envelope pore protein 21, chloroplastic n=1 Tax=Apostasia shenzhenica TaxID=1088818 RepID=A0A2H9ZST3_9ASPA|nr:Outer envelope pore protein 21, chloroplastic [Apostasia shenzhenica]